MADKILYVLSNGQMLPVLLHDILGDGTQYSIAVDAAAGSSTTIGGPLGAHGGVAVEGVASGTPVPVSGTVAATGTVAIDQTTPNTTNRVTAGLYGKVTNPGDTAILVTAAGRQIVAGGTANTAGAAITGGTVTSVDSADVARALATALFLYNGSTNEPMRNPNVFKDMSAVAIGSIATVWTPAGGKKFRLMGGVVSVSAAANVLFEDNSGGNFIFRVPKLLVDTPFAFTLGGNGFLSAAANNVLKATSSASASITGTLYGCEE